MAYTGNREVEVSRDQIEALSKTMAFYRGTFGRLLPSSLGIDSDTFVGAAASALWKAPKTAQAAIAHPDSLIVALRECARLGHIPGSKEFALGVRKGQVVPLEMYSGIVERMFRSGGVTAVYAEVVCRGESFIKRDPLPPLHGVEDWLNRNVSVDNLTGAYAYAMLSTGGCSRVIVMGREEIMRHKKFAEMDAIWNGPFGHTMWLKTVAKALESWVPTSVEFARERARVEAVLGNAADRTVPAPPPLADLQDLNDVGDAPGRPDDMVEGEVVP
jgi:recombination protein RecT